MFRITHYLENLDECVAGDLIAVMEDDGVISNYLILSHREYCDQLHKRRWIAFSARGRPWIIYDQDGGQVTSYIPLDASGDPKPFAWA